MSNSLIEVQNVHNPLHPSTLSGMNEETLFKIYENPENSTKSFTSLCYENVVQRFSSMGKCPHICLSTLLSTFAVVLRIGSVFFLNQFLEHVAHEENQGDSVSDSEVYKLVIQYSAILIGAELLSYVSSWTIDKAILEVSHDTAIKLIEHTIHIPMNKFDVLLSNEPTSLLATIPYNLRSLVLKTTVDGIPNILQLIGVGLASVFVFDKTIGAIEFTSGFLYLGLSYYMSTLMHQTEKNYSQMARFIYRFDLTQLDYLMTTKIFNAFEFEKHTAHNIFNKLTPLKARLQNIERLANKIQQIMLCISGGFILAMTANNVTNPSRPEFTMQDLIAITVYYQLFTAPMIAIGNSFLEISIHMVAIKKMAQIFDMDIEAQNELNYVPPVDLVQESIHFKDVCFSYTPQSNSFIINNLSFELEAGKKIALVGNSGIGKSTILKLILGLYPLDSGQILIGGKNINEMPKGQLRQKIGYIEQKTKIFPDDSVKSNIAYNQSVSDESLDTILKKANLFEKARREATEFHDKDQLHPQYAKQTMFSLSGGEALKVGIARALTQHRDIYLLDEPTAALDSENAYDILNELSVLLKNKTAVLISHQLLHMISVDLIIFAHDMANTGEIPQIHYVIGTHEDILDIRSSAYEKYRQSYEKYIREVQKHHIVVKPVDECIQLLHGAYSRCFELQSDEAAYSQLFK